MNKIKGESMNGYMYVCESLQKSVKFIIHKHQPRSGSLHYDLRFMDPNDTKLLHSFAAPKNFLETIDSKTSVVKTRDHDPRWLTLKSYRLEDVDVGLVTIKVATKKYFELEFHGKIIKGHYKLFKLKTRRDDYWLLIKK
jgi:hypothetical protein